MVFRIVRVVILAMAVAALGNCASPPTLSPLLHLARYVQPGQLTTSGPIDVSSIPGYAAIVARTQDVAGSFGAVGSGSGAAPRAFTVSSPEGSFTYQISPLNLSFGTQSVPAMAAVYTIEQNGEFVTWGEVNVAANGSVSSMVILGQPDGSTQIETASDFLGQIQSGPALQPLGNSNGSGWGCDIVETACTTALSFGKTVLCEGQTIDIGLAIVSCVGILFTDGLSAEACMVTVAEATIATPLCGKLAGIIEDAAGDAACKALVGCNPALAFLGCNCEWTDPCNAAVDSVCGALADAAICDGSNAVASGLVSAQDIAE